MLQRHRAKSGCSAGPCAPLRAVAGDQTCATRGVLTKPPLRRRLYVRAAQHCRSSKDGRREFAGAYSAQRSPFAPRSRTQLSQGSRSPDERLGPACGSWLRGAGWARALPHRKWGRLAATRRLHKLLRRNPRPAHDSPPAAAYARPSPDGPNRPDARSRKGPDPWPQPPRPRRPPPLSLPPRTPGPSPLAAPSVRSSGSRFSPTAGPGGSAAPPSC